MTDKQIIIDDCPHFIGGCCQEYLDGVCENHKCDLKIIRELEQQLKAKEQECEGLKEKVIKWLGKEGLRQSEKEFYEQQLDQLKKQNDIMLNSIKKLQNKLCSNTSQCKYFLIDVLKEVENASK